MSNKQSKKLVKIDYVSLLLSGSQLQTHMWYSQAKEANFCWWQSLDGFLRNTHLNIYSSTTVAISHLC